MPSPSLSRSGQPSSSWKPSLSSGSFGHLVDGVRDAVAIVVEIRAAILVLEAVLVLRLIRALVEIVRNAIAVPIVAVGLSSLIVSLKMCTFSISPKLTKSEPSTQSQARVADAIALRNDRDSAVHGAMIRHDAQSRSTG